MNIHNFYCASPDCGTTIPFLLQQGGMRIDCPNCGYANTVPALAQPSPPPALKPAPLAPADTLSSQAKDYGRQMLAEELGPLGSLLGGKKKDQVLAADAQLNKEKPSLIDRLYTAVGGFIDKQLASQPAEAGSFREKLLKVRAEYLRLSSYRRRHIAFFISSILVLLLFAVISGSFYLGLYVALVYASFVALNQLSFLNRIFSAITDIVVALTVFFLPEQIKGLMASLLKYVVYIIIVINFGLYLGPAYVLYKAALVVMDKQEA